MARCCRAGLEAHSGSVELRYGLTSPLPERLHTGLMQPQSLCVFRGLSGKEDGQCLLSSPVQKRDHQYETADGHQRNEENKQALPGAGGDTIGGGSQGRPF